MHELFTKSQLIYIVEYLQEKTAPLREERCCDDYDVAFKAFKVVFRYARKKFGTDAAALSAIAAWEATSLGGMGNLDYDLLEGYEMSSRCSEILRAMFDARVGHYGFTDDRLLEEAQAAFEDAEYEADLAAEGHN